MQDYALLQDAIRHMPKRDAIEHLNQLFPHRTERWFSRNLPYLMALDEDAFYDVLTYKDPTANKAIHNLQGATP